MLHLHSITQIILDLSSLLLVYFFNQNIFLPSLEPPFKCLYLSFFTHRWNSTIYICNQHVSFEC